MDGFELTKLCIQFDFGSSNAVAKSVLVALASHYNEDNGKVWPGADALCREASCHRNSLFNAIKWLRDNGLVEAKRTWGGNVYKFNVELIRRGYLVGSTKSNTLQSIESDTNVSTKNSTYESTGFSTNESTEFSTNVSTGFSTSVSTKNDTLESTKNDTYQSTNIRTQTNKEQIKEQIINQETLIKSCFNSFGSNPVARPVQWQPDEEDYDQPLRNQINMARRIDVDINDDHHKLTASEMVVLAATLGYRVTHNVILDEIASEKVITTAMFKEAVQRTKDNVGGVGYLIRVLQNAVRDPYAFNGQRKTPDITAETITDKQCYAFAKRLVAYHPFASKNAKYMEEESAMVDRITGRLKDQEFFEYCRPTLIKLGCIKGAAA